LLWTSACVRGPRAAAALCRQSLHAVDTLIAALRAMRSVIVVECAEFDRRERLLYEERNLSS
jgi:hypothetical protein